MFPLTAQRQTVWRSPDGLMEVGMVAIGAESIAYAHLGARPVELSDIQGLIRFLEKISASTPLLLISCCPGFASSAESEAQGMVLLAGQYRALQQRHKQAGGLILAYLYEIAVGGTYLMHGLSAHHRAAAPDTRFHDTVLNQPAVPLEQAQAKGLIDTIFPPAALENWVTQQCSVHHPAT